MGDRGGGSGLLNPAGAHGYAYDSDSLVQLDARLTAQGETSVICHATCAGALFRPAGFLWGGTGTPGGAVYKEWYGGGTGPPSADWPLLPSHHLSLSVSRCLSISLTEPLSLTFPTLPPLLLTLLPSAAIFYTGFPAHQVIYNMHPYMGPIQNGDNKKCPHNFEGYKMASTLSKLTAFPWLDSAKAVHSACLRDHYIRNITLPDASC